MGFCALLVVCDSDTKVYGRTQKRKFDIRNFSLRMRADICHSLFREIINFFLGGSVRRSMIINHSHKIRPKQQMLSLSPSRHPPKNIFSPNLLPKLGSIPRHLRRLREESGIGELSTDRGVKIVEKRSVEVSPRRFRATAEGHLRQVFGCSVSYMNRRYITMKNVLPCIV